MKQVTKNQVIEKPFRHHNIAAQIEGEIAAKMHEAVGLNPNRPRWRDASEHLGKATDDVLTRRKRNFAEITSGITVQEYADRFKINNGKAKGDLVWLSREGLVGHYQEVRKINGSRRRLTVYTPRRRA